MKASAGSAAAAVSSPRPKPSGSPARHVATRGSGNCDSAPSTGRTTPGSHTTAATRGSAAAARITRLPPSATPSSATTASDNAGRAHTTSSTAVTTVPSRPPDRGRPRPGPGPDPDRRRPPRTSPRSTASTTPVIKESESGEPSPPWTRSNRAGSPVAAGGRAGENSHVSRNLSPALCGFAAGPLGPRSAALLEIRFRMLARGSPWNGDPLGGGGPAVEGGVEAPAVGPPGVGPAARRVASTYQNPAYR